MTKTNITIIGGGIAGLSTAWYVQKEARARGQAVQVTVLEAGDRWGGKVRTDHVEGFTVEGGPDSFITQKPWAWQLAQELGLGEACLGTNDAHKQVFVLNHGRVTPLPEGVLLIIPTKFKPFALSPLISPLGKLRMGLDLLVPAKKDKGDETLADFVRRRLGQEALDKIAEPLMSGIYNADAEQQSVAATFPRFQAIEQKHGSLIRGMLAAQKARRAAKPRSSQGPGPKPPSVFVSFREGTQTLIAALVDQLTAQGVDLRLNTAVSSLATASLDSEYDGYTMTTNDGHSHQADVVICATPAYITADLLETLAPPASELLHQIRYVSTGTLSLAYRRSDLPALPEGFGVVIPRTEERQINAITFSSVKFAQRAPDESLLLRVFFGGSRTPQTISLEDDALLRVVKRELADMVGITAVPLFHRLYRWHQSNPQYDVGHLDKVAAIEAALPPGIWVTGSAYRGVGLPDCVHQAQQTATAVWTHRAEPALVG